ncbi:MAG TPA: nucleotidyltransferase family protein [Terriglobales bacterium]|jgi:dTDP-glucose pyrophosphorylase|nr:nucleotidyltransferase family protein [Terriglobales bacterium]
MRSVEKFFTSKNASLRAVMACIDRGAKGIALVVDQHKRLIATLTDGDLRRAVLDGFVLDQPVADLLGKLESQKKTEPVTLPQGSSKETILQEMQTKAIRQIPLISMNGEVTDLAVLDELVSQPDTPVHAVVMAGGYGKRLMPLTETTPKPMLRVGERPLIERLVQQLKQAGVARVNISTHYKAEQIASHLGNGEAFGVEVEYVSEEIPLGTAGGLSLVSGDDPLLVINGDILTALDFRALLNFHFEHGADMTVAVREYGFDVPYGVVETDGLHVTSITEKPSVKFFVNAGIYLISASARGLIPTGQHFDMPELIQTVVHSGGRVISFPIWEYWLDIGRQEDLERAQEDIRHIGEGA